LNSVHNIRHHLTRPLRIHAGAQPKGVGVDQLLAELLAQVSLNPPELYLDKFPHELSGGQRQRVAIARALAARPSVLLADEPISMLDVSIRLGVLNLLDDLRSRLDLAVLYITHDIASARYFAEETVVMYAGQVVEHGPSEDLTQEPAHPYTQLLLSSSPDPDRLGREAEGDLDLGAPPSLVEPPSGCRFHPRCPSAMPVCRVENPPAIEVSPGRTARCWLHDPGHGSGQVPAADLGSARPR
ncbi:MAG: ABC transporter ATP-binding protein, partial [Actinomycetota bacterium]|nr:ABC transporter ATP-binding protein [Actinomycetota bacterium]